MSELAWYRSLYWRLALGLVAFLALMLAAQAGLFLWVSDRIAGSMPASSPRRLAVLVASDLGTALATNPQLDLGGYVAEQYGRVLLPFAVVMRDGQTVSNQPSLISDEQWEELRVEARRAEGRRRRTGGERGPVGTVPDGQARADGSLDRPARRRADRPFPGPDPDGPGGGTPGGRQGGDGLRGGPGPGRPLVPILVGGEPTGVVMVPMTRPPFGLIVRGMAPTLAVPGVIVLGVGSALIALMVFGPTRRRLKLVEAATVRLGEGDFDARAPEDGGDEVTALARAFNRMATELNKRATALQVSDRARRQLLADVSHELMTPLTAMRGYVETLRMPDLQIEPPTRERYLGIIDEETHRLERIVGDLLDLARLEGGGTVLRRAPVDLGLLFSRVAARHERELAARQITLVRQVQAPPRPLHADPDRLEQALQNLAANALRHIPDGGTLTLQATGSQDEVRLVVRDTGPGIAAEHLPLIFDRFYKADAARASNGGSGLGLSIVKAIVERHGGSISARNDGGAVFEIVLPLPDPQ